MEIVLGGLEVLFAGWACSVGTAIVITRGKIFGRVRESAPGGLGGLLSCPMCTGWWAGSFFMLAYLALGAPLGIAMSFPFASAAIAPLLDPVRLWR